MVVQNAIQKIFNRRTLHYKQKIFCIGFNKTGTTTLEKEFKIRGFLVNNQIQASHLTRDYFDENWSKILEFCETAEVFQDVPFSFPNTYKHLYHAYPKAKFILSVRDSQEEWYQSLTKFHAKLFGNGKLPNAEQLKNVAYIYKGWLYENRKQLYNLPDNDLYNKEVLQNSYLRHNQDVRNFFKNKENFLEINVSKKEDYPKFCDFFNFEQNRNHFLWENKT